MSEICNSVSYDRPKSEPLRIEWLSDPDQISESVALGAMRTLGAAYASSPGICDVVHPSDVWKHFVPMTSGPEDHYVVDPAAIMKRREHMQKNIALQGVSYGIASDADRPSQMTGLIKVNSSDSTGLQKLRRKFGVPSSNLFVSELVERPTAKGASLGLLHAALKSRGYDPKRELVIDVYNKDHDQRTLAIRRLHLAGMAVGSTCELGGVQLCSTRFGGQSIGWARHRLEAYTPWLKNGALDSIDTER